MSPRCVHPTFSAMRSHSVSQEPRLVCKLLLAPRLCTPMDAPVLWRLADLLHWHHSAAFGTSQPLATPSSHSAWLIKRWGLACARTRARACLA